MTKTIHQEKETQEPRTNKGNQEQTQGTNQEKEQTSLVNSPLSGTKKNTKNKNHAPGRKEPRNLRTKTKDTKREPRTNNK